MKQILSALALLGLASCQTLPTQVELCRPEDWVLNWARVSDMDRSLALYTDVLGYHVEESHMRPLDRAIETSGTPRRIANLCHDLGQVGTLSLVEAPAEDLIVPLEDQPLDIRVYVTDLGAVLAELPDGLGDEARTVFVGDTPNTYFYDWDRNRISLMPSPLS